MKQRHLERETWISPYCACSLRMPMRFSKDIQNLWCHIVYLNEQLEDREREIEELESQVGKRPRP